MRTHIALLRGINVGGHRKVPMADLRNLSTSLGFQDVRTYIQSGNLLYRTPLDEAAAAAALAAGIAAHFGFPVDVVVRDAAGWPALLADNPFPALTAEAPTRVHAVLTQAPAPAGAAERLLAAARAGESVVVTPLAAWLHYPAGAGTTKITPALLDKALGGPATARGWRTLEALAALASS
ncbi:MAG: DUF1697 domain-containing protein [Myxococcales bacterium]|nr:DUF1697 domain-containing protein [Myxococcales bacterium]